MLADLARIAVFVSAAVIIGLAVRTMLALIHRAGLVPAHSPVGSALLAAGLASLATSGIISGLQNWNDAFSAPLGFALFGFVACAAGLFLLRGRSE